MQVPVLIVGGGPVGLACSLFLSRLKISHLLVERHPGTSRHPKAMGLMTRTMEILRPFGVAADLEQRSLPRDWMFSTFWCTSLFGEILREIPLMAGDTIKLASFSPCRALHCPQTVTEAMLLHRAMEQPTADLRFFHELTEFSQDADGVKATILDRNSGERTVVAAQFMIAADGTHGTVRERLGIERQGPPDLGHFANIYFGANVAGRLGDRKGMMFHCLSDSDFGSVVAINGKDEWLMHHFLFPGETNEMYSHEYSRALVSKISGIPESEITIFGVSPWVMSAQIAERFREGGVFLTGDAAHRTTPAGGLGLNTGVQSAHNLCWKLAAVLRGWCHESILESYEEERRPVVLSNIESSKERAGGLFPLIEAACTGRWAEALEMIQKLPPTHSQVARDLGIRYNRGAFFGLEPREVNFDAPFVPDFSVGGRAPHGWLPATDVPISTLDLFGDSFVVLCSGETKADYRTAFESAPAGAIQVVEVSASVLESVYGLQPKGGLLVRPDGFIAWRSEVLISPEQGREVLKAVLKWSN